MTKLEQRQRQRKRKPKRKPKKVARKARRHSPHTERRHQVRLSLNVNVLTKAGTALELLVFDKGEKVGTIEIGRGSLFWRAGKAKRAKRIDWERFVRTMEELRRS